jgi:hypothetical protein
MSGQYPRQDGDVTLLGPECFTDSTGTVITWKGSFFYRPGGAPGDSPTWEALASSLRRERDALFAEVSGLRRYLRDIAAGEAVKVVIEPDTCLGQAAPPDELPQPGAIEVKDANGNRWFYSLAEFLDRRDEITVLIHRLHQQQILAENLALGRYFEVERDANGQVTALRPLALGRLEYDGERYIVVP